MPTPGEPEREPMLQFFQVEDNCVTRRPIRGRSDTVGDICRSFGLMAQEMVGLLQRSPERTVMLRKLLESKDAAVRAALGE